MRKSKQSRAREFSPMERQKIELRDRGKCIFCEMGYRAKEGTWLGLEIKSIMHYIPRSKNGLGIEQNGAVGCQYHHEMMDNGNKGNREEMLEIFREYLKSKYPDWNEKDLIYDKWRFLKEEGQSTIKKKIEE